MALELVGGIVGCAPIAVIGGILLLSGVRIVMQYEAGIKFTLGKFSGKIGPGVNFVIPFIQSIRTVDTRIQTIDIPKQEVMTRDNVPMNINGVVFYKVENAENAILKIQDYHYSISQYAQTALRDIIGNKDMDTVLSNRDEVANEITAIVDKETQEWGVDISNIKLQDIELPADMKRIMAKQAEAERDKRAKIIESEGELIASEKVAKAAETLSKTPGGLHLKTLLTISNVAAFDGNSVVFVTPVEILDAFKGLAGLGGVKKKE
jgi:regulator of protease activity HflC (stomatin/prohibitin superfamily)